MKSALFRVLVLAACVVLATPGRGEIITVILSDAPSNESLTISGGKDPDQSKTLNFDTATALPEDALVSRCELRVVAKQGSNDQSVQVRSAAGGQIGQWTAYKDEFRAYGGPLENPGKECARSAKIGLTLRGESSFPTEWQYYGGSAKDLSNHHPRLIVTYKSASRESTTVSGDRTSWAYHVTDGFFAAPLLPTGGKLLSNPAAYGGGVFAVVQRADKGIYVEGARAPAAHKLNGGEENSFALATAWGWMYVITTKGILRRDLAQPGASETSKGPKLAVGKDETPALGRDGAVYLRNMTEEGKGQIVAYSPALREIWRTDRMLTAISPIVLNEESRFAYVLARYALKDKPEVRSLFRIDTATGVTVEHSIEYDKIQPPLEQLYRPAVVRKEDESQDTFDYVFVAGNTNDNGILQLIRFKVNARQPENPDRATLWTQVGDKFTSPPLIDGKGDNAYIVQGKRYPRVQEEGKADLEDKLDGYDMKTRAILQGGALKRYPRVQEEGKADLEDKLDGYTAGTPAILAIDRTGSIYVHAGTALYAQDQDLKLTKKGQVSSLKGMFFTTDGALVGYDAGNLYDISPMASANRFPLKKLASGTIYSGYTVTVTPDAAKDLKKEAEVILKGNSIRLPREFQWPLGATLRMQTVPTP